MAESTDLTRVKKKLIALRRAERRLEIAFDSIDWELDVLAPEVAKLGTGSSVPLPELVEKDEDA